MSKRSGSNLLQVPMETTASVASSMASSPSQHLDLKSMSPRQRVFNELVQTETNFITVLKTILQVFKKPLDDPNQIGGPLLNQTELKIIFGNLPPIYDAHAKMLSVRFRSHFHDNRASQSVVFNTGQKMALRAFYFIRTLTKALTYYYINRSQRHLLVAIENNRFRGRIVWRAMLVKIRMINGLTNIINSYFPSKKLHQNLLLKIERSTLFI